MNYFLYEFSAGVGECLRSVAAVAVVLLSVVVWRRVEPRPPEHHHEAEQPQQQRQQVQVPVQLQRVPRLGACTSAQ